MNNVAGSSPLPFPAITHAWQEALDAAAADGDHRPTWAHDWPAGNRLCTILAELLQQAHKGTQHHLRCCDLGCGRGRLGFELLSLGFHHISFADGSSHPLRFVAAMLDHYQLAGHCYQHRWGTPIPNGPYDLILGGDILYRPECHAELMNSIAASLSAQGEAWLSDPRQKLEEHLPELATDHGLKMHQFRHDEALVTIVKLTKR